MMRYDLKEMGMILLPMYGALLALGIAAGLSMRYSIMRGAGEVLASTVPEVLTIILFLVFGIMGLVTGLVMIIMIQKNFHDNLLGNRGYLMNTLPVTAFGQVMSKMLSSILVILGGAAAAAVSGYVFLLINFRKQDWEEAGEAFRDAFGGKLSPAAAVCQILILVLLWMIEMVTKLYFSNCIGSLLRGHRIIGTILAFVGITVLQNLIGSLLTHLTSDASIGYSLMGAGIRMIFRAGETGQALFTLRQMAFSLGQNLTYAILFLAGTIWLLKNRLNLE